MILTAGNISQGKIIEISQFLFKPTNIGLLFEIYNTVFKNNTIKYTKINKYFHQII